MNRGLWLPRPVKIEDLRAYLSLLEVNGLSNGWIYTIEHHLLKYLEFTGWMADKAKTLEYLKLLKEKASTSYYRKISYQIRKFLSYLNIEWAKDIKPPKEPDYEARRITAGDIIATIEYFRTSEYFIQLKALILLGATSGLRAEELYKLTMDDIDLANRVVYVRHNPKEGKTTKTSKSRISFFSMEAKEALEEYFNFFKHARLKKLFSKTHIERLFRKAPIRVKDLRKFFSQQWERLNGSYAVKELLLGHSIKRSVDLQHYTYLDEEDLRQVYEQVMGNYRIMSMAEAGILA